MTVPYSLLIIKPLTIGRGEGPEILEHILRDCPLNLVLFRQWPICDTTLAALHTAGDTSLAYETERLHSQGQRLSWICLFTTKDRVSDPFVILSEYCGPLDPLQWTPRHLRGLYGGYSRIGKTAHPSDTVVHIANPDRVSLEANLLFLNFDENRV